MAQITLTPPPPFNFKAVLFSHGWFQLTPFYWQPKSQTLLWATRLPDQTPLLLRLTGSGEKNAQPLLLDADHEISAHKNDLIKKCRHVFNLDLDLTDFYALCKKDPLLKGVIAGGRGRLMRAESVYENIFKAICGTNVQWKQAVNMINRIGSIGTAASHTEYRCFPTPQQVLQAGESFLKTHGRVGYRSRYLIDLCRRFAAGEPEAKAAQNGSMQKAELKRYFLSFSGIGKTTARYLMALYGHFDEIAVDSLVISCLSKTVFDGNKPSEQQVHDYFAHYGKWAYLAYWMEFILAGGWQPENR